MIDIPDYTFKAPTSISISGTTSSGKTTLVKRILETPSLFSIEPKRIVYCYNVWQPTFETMSDTIEFRKGVHIPTLDPAQHTVIVFDDLMDEILTSKEAVGLFTVGSHHNSVTPLLIMQNLFHQTKYSKTIMMNIHYLILMNNSRDLQQIKNLGRQLGLERSLVDAYKDCMNTKYGYLLVNLSPHKDKPELTLQTNIFPSETLTVYLT